MKKTCTCIIPFYNEEKNILWVLEKLVKINFFDKIIAVDDWSVDNSKNIVEKFKTKTNNSNISIISYSKNKWKSYAVGEWLKKVNTDYVFLFDADISNIKIQEINDLIQTLYDNVDIDMWILRRIYAKWYIKLLYRELILSGQRMIKTQDLKNIFTKKIDWYQLEVAINQYMYNNKKITVWFPFSWENSFKSDKWWFWNGWKRDFFMYQDIIQYQWFINFFKHIFLFNPYNIKIYQKKFNKI